MLILDLYTPADPFNWGTLLFPPGIGILLIACMKFWRNLTRWQKKIPSSRQEDPGTR